jgi:hypothetical protein
MARTPTLHQRVNTRSTTQKDQKEQKTTFTALKAKNNMIRK